MSEIVKLPKFDGDGSDGMPGSDDEGRPFYGEDLVKTVKMEADRRRNERLPYELQWRLNRNFLAGNQHCDIDVRKMTVENYRPPYDYMSEEIFNKIAPIMESRMAQFKSVSYDMEAVPETTGYEDVQQAAVAGALIVGRIGRNAFKKELNRAMGLCETDGTTFFLCWWDKEKGEPVDTVLSSFEILPADLTEESVEGQSSIIIEQVKSPEEIFTLYGVKVRGEKVHSYASLSTAGAGGFGYRSGTALFTPVERENCVVLRNYLEKPSGKYPQGRMVITAGDTLIYSGILPYEEYPLVSMKAMYVTGQFFGRSVIETMIPLQRSYNGIKNRINDYINRSACGQILIEEGSVDADDITERGLEPGASVIYARGATPPKLMEEPTLSALAETQCAQLVSDMEYAAGVSALSANGILPNGVNSGTAIGRLQNIDSVRLSLYTENYRAALLCLAEKWITLYRNYLSEERAVRLVGNGARGAVALFTGRTLKYGVLRFLTENELKVKEDEQRERYLEALKLGLFSEEDGSISAENKRFAVKKLLGTDKSPPSEADLQHQNAQNENIDFELGEVLRIEPLDDHVLHLTEHRLYVLEDSFRERMKKDPHWAEPMLEHIKEHESLLKEEKK